MIPDPIFLNFSFDKNRLKNVVSWFLERNGQYKTIEFLENLKKFGFGYATKGGLSLGIDDLKIPNNKIDLISKAETKVSKDLMDFRNSKITGIERMQRLIYTWNQTNDMLKQEVLQYFEKIDLFNPIYMMAFSGARGNMSQVRQLVGMRGLMSDPQGQIIDFPILSNFREGLTLTEYLISTYGARKGIVDTALRTATAGYLTRRLVDVAQHVIVSQFDCQTSRGIFLFDMKEANKTIYSFQNRLIGRVLAQDLFSPVREKQSNEKSQKKLIASRNQEIHSKLAFAISKVAKKALVRSPLTCETPRLICQLCYGWSLSQGKLVSVGEAVGVIAAQSIGEPGTQLTMRTFHTGGVFAGGLTDQILAPFDGKIQYFQNIPGSCVRMSLSEIAFFTKMPGSFFVFRDFENQNIVQDLSFSPHVDETSLFQVQDDWKSKKKNFSVSEIYKIPAYAVLFLRNHEFVQKKQVLAQFSTISKKQFQYGSAEQTLYSTLAGEFSLNTSNIFFQKKKDLLKVELLVETRNSDCFHPSNLEFKNDILWKLKDWTNIWILSGKIFSNSFDSNFFIQEGDFLKKTTILHRILWKKTKNWNLSVSEKQKIGSLPFFSKGGMGSYASNFSHFSNFSLWHGRDATEGGGLEGKTKKIFSLKAIEISKKNTHFGIFRKNTKKVISKFCFLNLWTTFPKQIKNKNKSFPKKKKSFKKNFPSTGTNTFFHSSHPGWNETRRMGNTKFFNPKKDFLFSTTFQFVFSFLVFFTKKFPFKKQKNFRHTIFKDFVLKQKKPFFKKFLLKFSSFAQTSPFLKFSKFVKKFHTSHIFRKRVPILKNFCFQKNIWKPTFLFSKNFSFKIFYQYIPVFFSEKKNFLPINSKKKHQKVFCFSFFSKKKRKQNFLFSKISFFDFSRLNSFKASKNWNQFQKMEKIDSKQVLLKKTVFSFQYERLRYKKFGYLFSFSDFSKNFRNCFRTFTTLKQSTFGENFQINLGKQQKGLSIGNDNFFGKDFPSFLGYYFPNNTQSLTNGFFSFLVFENLSKTKKFSQFFCFQEKSFFLNIYKNFKIFKNQKKKNEKKKSVFSFQQKKVTFLISSPFDSISKKMQNFESNLIRNPKTIVKQKSLLFWYFPKKTGNFQNFSFFFHKKKNSPSKNFKIFVFYSLELSKKNQKSKKFSNFQLYTNEIFWFPQENLSFSVLDWNFIGKKMLNFDEKIPPFEKNTETYLSEKIFKKTPLFYFSNRQGKKKKFFPFYEGIWNWSIFSFPSKYQNCCGKNRKILNRKKKVLQQKLSIFQNRNLFKKKHTSFPFFSIKKNKKRKKLKTLYSQKKSTIQFFQWKFFLKNFYKTNILLKKSFVFKQKNKKFFKVVSKLDFANTLNKKWTNNFISSFQNKPKNLISKKIQKLFSQKIPSSKYVEQSKIQKKVGQQVNSNCFTCLPFQNKMHQKNIEKYIFSFSKNSKSVKYLIPERNKAKESFLFDSKNFRFKSFEIHLKIQSGWICCFPNTLAISNWHQSRANLGHFFSKDLCFEQNKILRETIVLKNSSIFLNSKPVLFKQFKQNKLFQRIENSNILDSQTKISSLPSIHNGREALPFEKNRRDSKKGLVERGKSILMNFSIQSFKTNKTFRYKTDGSCYAIENFESFFLSKTNLNKKQSFLSKTEKQKINIFPLRNENRKTPFFKEKQYKLKKKLALFLRPMQYKIVENPKNYKKFFLNETLQNSSSQKNSISFVSSLKIYKKYHSNFLNCQKQEKIFLQSFKNFDAVVDSAFEKTHWNKMDKKKYQIFSVQTSVNKVQKNRNVADFGFSKKDKMKKFFPIQKSHSKKKMFFKFQNILNRDFSENFSSLKKRKKTSFGIQSFSKNQKNTNTLKFHNHCFFSFYPIQFLPLSISVFSWNRNDLDFQNLQNFPLFFFNPLNTTIDFSICQKKAAFFKQRSRGLCWMNLFQKYFGTSSFWLNKDGLNFFISQVFFQKMSENFWKNFTRKQKIYRTKTNLFSTFYSKTKIDLFKNFLFQKNQYFFANTQFFSPFQGEILSMQTNDTIWWKKASEISTIQKIKNFSSIVTKKDLFAVDFSISNFQKMKGENSLFLNFSNQNQKKIQKQKQEKDFKKNFHFMYSPISSNEKTNSSDFRFFENHEKSLQNLKYDLKMKQHHLYHLFDSVLKKQKTLSFFESFSFYKDQSSQEISSFVTKYEKKVYKFRKFKIGYPILSQNPRLGKFFVYGDCLFDLVVRKPGQIVHFNCLKATLRCGQPFLVSPNGILHLANTPYIQKNIPILTLPYQTVQSGDIVQGIPKVEQFFEARTTLQGRLFLSSLPILLKGIFERYKSILPLEQAVRQSFLKIQQLIVDGVQRVYRSQGVTIVDKHLEVIVRQMTTKVQILHGAQTGFFPGELVNLNLVERINKFLLVKVRYEPVILGITRASLEVESFLSASSFQQTTKILSLAAVSRKKDFLKGLKENILVGNLIPSGTGFMILRKNREEFPNS